MIPRGYMATMFFRSKVTFFFNKEIVYQAMNKVAILFCLHASVLYAPCCDSWSVERYFSALLPENDSRSFVERATVQFSDLNPRLEHKKDNRETEEKICALLMAPVSGKLDVELYSTLQAFLLSVKQADPHNSGCYTCVLDFIGKAIINHPYFGLSPEIIKQAWRDVYTTDPRAIEMAVQEAFDINACLTEAKDDTMHEFLLGNLLWHKIRKDPVAIRGVLPPGAHYTISAAKQIYERWDSLSADLTSSAASSTVDPLLTEIKHQLNMQNIDLLNRLYYFHAGDCDKIKTSLLSLETGLSELDQSVQVFINTVSPSAYSEGEYLDIANIVDAQQYASDISFNIAKAIYHKDRNMLLNYLKAYKQGFSQLFYDFSTALEKCANQIIILMLKKDKAAIFDSIAELFSADKAAFEKTLKRRFIQILMVLLSQEERKDFKSYDAAGDTFMKRLQTVFMINRPDVVHFKADSTIGKTNLGNMFLALVQDAHTSYHPGLPNKIHDKETTVKLTISPVLDTAQAIIDDQNNTNRFDKAFAAWCAAKKYQTLSKLCEQLFQEKGVIKNIGLGTIFQELLEDKSTDKFYAKARNVLSKKTNQTKNPLGEHTINATTNYLSNWFRMNQEMTKNYAKVEAFLKNYSTNPTLSFIWADSISTLKWLNFSWR